MDFQLTASASICDERSTSFHRIFNYAPVTFFHFDLLRSVPKAKKQTFRRPKNYSILKWRKRNLSFPERCKPFCPALGLLPVESRPCLKISFKRGCQPPIPSPLFFNKKKQQSSTAVGSQWRRTFLFILLHRQDLILRRIQGLRRVLPTTGNRGPKTISSTTWTRGGDPTREMQKNMPSSTGQALAQN